MTKYDVIVVGAGPSGIFLCHELKKMNESARILLIDQGRPVEKRVCPVAHGGKCVKCKPFCHITNGFSGAGAFSDGKLSLFNEDDEEIYVGGVVHKYLGVQETKELIRYTDGIYLSYGADPRVEGVEFPEEIKAYKERSKRYGVDLISVPIRHLGTEKAHELYKAMQDSLIAMGVDLLMNTMVSDLLIQDGKACGVVTENPHNLESCSVSYYADNVVLAVGRKGANWLSDMCDKHGIQDHSGIVDIGIRYELPDFVMKDINRIMYEAKFVGRLKPYEDKVRTFCQNPSGFVSSEVYDDGLTLVNGHSYKDKKSTNTNLAILCSHHFTYPFDQPLLYGRNIAKNANLLGNGQVLVQRLGDILTGHRSHDYWISRNSVEPTLKTAVAGDVTQALGYRTMTNILEFIKALDNVVPGFASADNLLYSPEIKFYSNELVIDKNFETSVTGLYSIGDAGGLTRGLMQASVSGVHLARVLKEKLK
ncbi:MAG: FAD-binding protein [Clostridia bacterium]|nr:FAD-binding protein [Clostridia bacterium]